MIQPRPVLMGALMAPMMLWMAHAPLMAGTFDIGWAAVGFLLGHVVVFGAVALAGLWLATRAPRVDRWIKRLHRPRLSHAAGMAAGAVLSAGIIHLGLHGGLA